MADTTENGEPKRRTLRAIRQARYRARARIADAQAELEELAEEEAGRGAGPSRMPDPTADRPGLEMARRVQGFTYPIDRERDDRRFSNALLNEVAEVMERRGFPPIQPGRDLARLMDALNGFLYRRPV